MDIFSLIVIFLTAFMVFGFIPYSVWNINKLTRTKPLPTSFPGGVTNGQIVNGQGKRIQCRWRFGDTNEVEYRDAVWNDRKDEQSLENERRAILTMERFEAIRRYA